jgi:hypothetical protein
LLTCYYYFIAMKRSYLNSGGKQGALVISTNLSAGFDNLFPADKPLICQAYDSLGAVGILSSVATINKDLDIDKVGDIPGTCPSDYLIVTTYTTRYDLKSEAGYGLISVDIGACGENIPMINSQGTVDDNSSGTSFASPHVAGAISLLYQYCSKITRLNKTEPITAVKLIKDFILRCGDDISALQGITTSGKRLNMIKSLQCLNDYCLNYSDTIKCRFLLKNNLLNEPIQVIYHPEAFGDYNLFVYNNLGQIMYTKVLNYSPEITTPYTIEIYGWPSGVYHILLEGQGFKCAESLIKL